MARTSTNIAYNCGCTIKIKKIFTWYHGIIVPRDEVFDNRQVRELNAPSSPFTYLTDSPAFKYRKPLTSSAPKGVGTIRNMINLNVQKIVSKHFKEKFRGLQVLLDYCDGDKIATLLTIGSSFSMMRPRLSSFRNTCP